jgi:hypothetical protein
VPGYPVKSKFDRFFIGKRRYAGEQFGGILAANNIDFHAIDQVYCKLVGGACDEVKPIGR